MLAQAKTAIEECEGRLRALMADASASGNYDLVDKLTAWARTLHSLGESAAVTQTTPSLQNISTILADEGVSRRKLKNTKKRQPRSEYPKFSRFREEIVKTGWSKKEKKEYQHRAPWHVVQLLCGRLSDYRGKVFVSDDIFPLVNDEGEEVPSYQSYLGLAWLKAEELIVQEGRQGYNLIDVASVLSLAEERWKNLPQKR